MGDKPTVYEDFADKVGQTFKVLGLGDVTLELTLKEAKLLPVYPGAPATRPPFSLMFDGPPDLLLQQGMYELEDAKLGKVSVFIVPVGRSADAISYQVIFN